MSITLHLSGGLGNQLFQYSAAKALAIKYNADLVVDLRYYWNSNGEPTKYHWITDFPLRVKLINQAHLAASPHSLSSRIKTFLNNKIRKNYCNFPQLGYFDEFEKLQSNVILSGLFQSHKFFEKSWDNVSQHLDLLSSGYSPSPSTVENISLKNYIGIHVRRGDYLENVGFLMMDSIGYYKKAIRLIRQTHEEPFLIFTDDPSWCMSQAVFDGIPIYESLINKPYNDMFALASCKVIITANSTFSWWAAWFGYHHGSKILMPREWILGYSSKDIDLAPNDWIVV